MALVLMGPPLAGLLQATHLYEPLHLLGVLCVNLMPRTCLMLGRQKEGPNQFQGVNVSHFSPAWCDVCALDTQDAHDVVPVGSQTNDQTSSSQGQQPELHLPAEKRE